MATPDGKSQKKKMMKRRPLNVILIQNKAIEFNTNKKKQLLHSRSAGLHRCRTSNGEFVNKANGRYFLDSVYTVSLWRVLHLTANNNNNINNYLFQTRSPYTT